MKRLKHTPEQWENCPNCNNEGAIPHHCCGGDEMICQSQCPDWEQCEFCWTNPKSVFNQKKLLASLAAAAPDMLEALISNYQTYQVLKEIFNKSETRRIWDMIRGAYVAIPVDTPTMTKNVIEKATGMKIEEVIE